MKKSKENSRKYSWGEDCLGWHLVNNPALSVIQELMPPNTEEVKHKHLKSQQFFFILKGEATFDVEGEITKIRANQGIYIEKYREHQIKNVTDGNLEFLVISQPHSHNDRITI